MDSYSLSLSIRTILTFLICQSCLFQKTCLANASCKWCWPLYEPHFANLCYIYERRTKSVMTELLETTTKKPVFDLVPWLKWFLLNVQCISQRSCQAIKFILSWLFMVNVGIIIFLLSLNSRSCFLSWHANVWVSVFHCPSS